MAQSQKEELRPENNDNGDKTKSLSKKSSSKKDKNSSTSNNSSSSSDEDKQSALLTYIGKVSRLVHSKKGEMEAVAAAMMASLAHTDIVHIHTNNNITNNNTVNNKTDIFVVSDSGAGVVVVDCSISGESSSTATPTVAALVCVSSTVPAAVGDGVGVGVGVVVNKESQYTQLMKPLQFADADSLHQYHYVSHLSTSSSSSSSTSSAFKARGKRLAQEYADLSHSLPLSLSSSVWLRVSASRMDALQFLISGPENTPYAHGLFLFDAFFTGEYMWGKICMCTHICVYICNCGSVCIGCVNE